MTTDILTLARQAGLYKPPCGVYYAVSDRQLQAFAALVRNAALEEAAVACEEADIHTYVYATVLHEDGARTIGNAAKAIRALKEQSNG